MLVSSDYLLINYFKTEVAKLAFSILKLYNLQCLSAVSFKKKFNPFKFAKRF